jgi:hypothetical protein
VVLAVAIPIDDFDLVHLFLSQLLCLTLGTSF